MSKKQVIAVDIDDVLAFTAEGWVDFTNKTWGMNLSADDYDEDWVKVWNIEYADALKRRDVVFGSGIHSQFEYNKEAKSVLQSLARKYRLIVVTSRLEIVRAETMDWLDKHFKGVFEDVKFSGFYDKHFQNEDYQDAVKQTKADLLQQLGASYLIDDQPKHCFAAAKIGVTSLLFGVHKWSQIEKLPDKVVRVKDWMEVERYFDAKG